MHASSARARRDRIILERVEVLGALGVDGTRHEADHPCPLRAEFVGQLLDQHGQPGAQVRWR